MRLILTVAVVLAMHPALIPPARADDQAARERRVRVALALAGTAPTPAADCGQCRDDVTAARAEGLKDGKPVVLFVGGCPGGPLAEAVCKAGGIPVKVSEYTDGERPPAEKRTVVLEPKADRSGFLRVSVPGGATAAELEAKVRASVPAAAKVAAKPLDWMF